MKGEGIMGGSFFTVGRQANIIKEVLLFLNFCVMELSYLVI